MARIRFAAGIRYLNNKQLYIIRQLLAGDRLLVENLSFGGQATLTYHELSEEWARGEVVFELHGPNVREPRDALIATEYTFNDFAHLPEAVQAEAWRRYQVILPLLRLPPKECTRAAIERHAKQVQKELDARLDRAQRLIAQRQRLRKRRARIGHAASASSIERWLKGFIESGYDVRALVADTRNSGGKKQSRLDPDVERIVDNVLEECKAHPKHRTVDDVRTTIINQVRDANEHRPSDQKLSPPGEATVYRRIRDKGIQIILRRRKSRLEEQADAPVAPGPRPTRIQERVEFDDTILDLIVVDEDDRLPIGRPTFTPGLDCFSGMPLGFYLGFEPPDYRAVMGSLLHCILPKPDVRELYGTQHEWTTYGLIETVVVDNGPHYIGHDMIYGCGQLGMVHEQMPLQKAWFKARVERFLRTDNQGLIHKMPGTTFSNVVQRGDYESVQMACISLRSLMRLMHVFLLDVYAYEWHKGIEGIPAKKWEQSVQQGFVPCLPHSARDTRMMLLPGDTRTIQRYGIDWESIRYQSPELMAIRTKLPHDARVRFKYDPGDVSHIFVPDPDDPTAADGWRAIPAIDPAGYTQGLTLWQHRVVRNYALRDKREVDIYALAAAKLYIQQIVEEEWMATRKVRGRKQAQRFLHGGSEPGADAPAAPASTPPSPPAPVQPAPTERPAPPDKPKRGRGRPRKAPVPTPEPVDEPEGTDLPGWSGTYVS